MKITFLGTAAAEAMPATFCNCKYCIEARRLGGKNIRTRSQTLIDDSLLIDLPADTYFHFIANGIEGDKISHLLITHSHGDHLDVNTVKMLLAKNSDLEFWCNKQSADRLADLTQKVTVVEFNKPVTFGKYTATPFHANHSPMLGGEQSFLYGISDGEKEVFYGTDTSWLPTETWYAMRTHQYDCMIMEVTLGDVIGDPRIFEHNNIRMVEIMMETFRKFGTVKPDTKVIATHIAKGTHGKHEQLTNRLACFGMIAAYDGYTVEI